MYHVDKVSQNEYVKQLTETDQEQLNQHESQKIEVKIMQNK